MRRQEVQWGKGFCQYSSAHLWQIKVNKQCRDSAVPWQVRSRSANMILTADFSRSAFKLFNCTVSRLCTKSILTFIYLASTFIVNFFWKLFSPFPSPPPLCPTEAGAAPFVFNKILESVHQGKVHLLKEGVALDEAVFQTCFSNGYWSLSQSYYFTSNIIASSGALQHKRQPGKHHNRIRGKKSPFKLSKLLKFSEHIDFSVPLAYGSVLAAAKKKGRGRREKQCSHYSSLECHFGRRRYMTAWLVMCN